jgi:hypothetical protein
MSCKSKCMGVRHVSVQAQENVNPF